jgi:hypothetical protein
MFSKGKKLFIKRSILLLVSFSFIACGSSSNDDDNNNPSPAPTSSPTPSPSPSGRVWTISEILLEPRRGGFGGTASCGGEFGFRRCVCAEQVPSSVRYRPAVAECNGNAAAILDGEYLDAFSIVVRDTQNRDRWPAAGSGFGGCSESVASAESPPNSCSAFKVQDKFEIANGTAKVYCFGASGYSDLFSDVVRVTIKLSDNPFSNDDDIDRLCLISGDKPLN